MESQQKFRLAKTVIILTFISILVIVISWMIVTHNPSTLKAAVDMQEETVEIECTFEEQ